MGHVAAMPDVHMGKGGFWNFPLKQLGRSANSAGVAIGAVFASEKYVCPNAVGVDIGCGMCAVPIKGLYKDDLSQEDLCQLQSFLVTVSHVFHFCITSIFF